MIPLLVACALAVLTFTCTGGFLVYQSTQHLIESRNWLDHSHNVLTSLQTESTRLDRISFGVQLYEATKDSSYLRSAQTASGAMHSGVLSLQSLMRDNPSQTIHIQELDAKAHALDEALNGTKEALDSSDRIVQECRAIIRVLQEGEREMVDQRTSESQSSRDRSLLSVAIFLGFFLLVVTVLFVALMRDTVRRQSFERKISLTNDQLEASIEELERRGSEAILLKSARDELQLCVLSKEAQDCAVRHFEELVPGSNGATVIINNSRSMLEVVSTWNNPASLAETFDTDACCGLRAGRPRWRRPGQSELNCSHFASAPPENYVCIPLAAQGETLGFVYLSCPTKEIADLASSRMPLVQEMVELASMAIAGLNLRAKLENQSIRDGLTGLFNRHFMEIALERELNRASRRRVPLAMMMLDVDHFKTFNDTFGHEAGDLVLRAVAESFEQCVRSEDIVCRYGGEEFAIILPEISEQLAVQRAETIRRNVSGLRIKFKGDTLRPISISIGLAMFPNPARDTADLLRMADQALYEAKHAGRDRIHIAGKSTADQYSEELSRIELTGGVLGLPVSGPSEI